VGYSLWGHKKSDTAEWLTLSLSAPRVPPQGRTHLPVSAALSPGVCYVLAGVWALSFLTGKKVTCYKYHAAFLFFFQLTIHLKHGSRLRRTDLPDYYNGYGCSVARPCLTLSDLMDCNPSGSSVHGVSQRILEWDVISFSRGSSWPRDWTWVSCISCIGMRFLYHCATPWVMVHGIAKSWMQLSNWAPVGIIIIRWMAMCGTCLSIHSLYHLSPLSVIYYLFLLSFTCPLSIIYCLSISPSIFLVSHCCYQQCCSEDQWMDFFECMSKYVHDRLVEVVFLGQRDSAFQILQSCSPQSLHQLCSPVWTTLPVFPHIFVGSILKTKILRPSYIYCL